MSQSPHRTLQRKSFIPKGINRATPIADIDDGRCHEIINMRFKDKAWRVVGNKLKEETPVVELTLYDILESMPLMDKKYVVGSGFYHDGADDAATGDLLGGGVIANPGGVAGQYRLIAGKAYVGETSWGAGKAMVGNYTAGGFDDWRLPTAGELQTIRMNLYLSHNTVPPFDTVLNGGFHWTSEESEDGLGARGSRFDTFNLEFAPKENVGFVIAVREHKSYQLRLIDTDTDTSTLIGQYSEDKQVEDITFFGRMMIVTHTQGKDIYKLNDDNEGFTLLEGLPEGQHTFWHDEQQKETIDLVEGSNSIDDNTAELLRKRYEDRMNGRFEGHSFFRLGWRLFDNTIIKHSALHYHHVGICNDRLHIDGNTSPWKAFNYTANKPKVRISFSEAEKQLVEQWKGIVRGLVVFMNDPISSFTEEWYDQGNDTFIFIQKDTDNLDDLFARVKTMYVVDEINLDDILAMQIDAWGQRSMVRIIECGDVNTIESNEVMPVDNFTNHDTTGAEVYEYNSRLHLGNITTVLKDCFNIGRYKMVNFEDDANKVKGMVFGEAEMLALPFDPVTVPGESVTGSILEYIPVLGLNYAMLINSNLVNDTATSYNATTGVYTASSDINLRIDIDGLFTLIGEDMNAYVIFEVINNDTGDRIWYDSKHGTYYGESGMVDFSVLINYGVYQGVELLVRAYLSSDPMGNNIIDGFLISSADISFNSGGPASFGNPFTPVLVVDIEAQQGTRITHKVIAQETAYTDGLTVYEHDGDFWVYMKEIITYPDKRAKKIRMLSKEVSGETITYRKLFEIDLIAHPTLNIAYSRPKPIMIGNYYYLRNMVYLGATGSLAAFSTTTLPALNNKITDTNRIQVSEINNPWLYPAKNSYRIGTVSNQVIRLATMSQAMSQGQWGQFPINVFTSQGVFNLNQGNENVLYLNITRQNMDVLISRSALLEIGGAIIYATSYGLFLLSGAERMEISEMVEGSVTGIATREDEWKLPADHIDFFSTSPFKQYLNGSIMMFDHNQNELVLSNPAYPYSYVYELLNRLWHKITFRPALYFTRGDGERAAVDDDGYLYNMEGEYTTITSQPVSLLTRPLLIEDRNMKKIERLVGRFINKLEDSTLAMHLFVSLDGVSWSWLSGATIVQGATAKVFADLILKRTHTSARYFMLSLGTAADETFELTGFDLDVMYKHQGKLR